MLQSMGSQRLGHNSATDQQRSVLKPRVAGVGVLRKWSSRKRLRPPLALFRLAWLEEDTRALGVWGWVCSGSISCLIHFEVCILSTCEVKIHDW